jgi:hypothetical protein
METQVHIDGGRLKIAVTPAEYDALREEITANTCRAIVAFRNLVRPDDNRLRQILLFAAMKFTEAATRMESVAHSGTDELTASEVGAMVDAVFAIPALSSTDPMLGFCNIDFVVEAAPGILGNQPALQAMAAWVTG